MDRLSDARALLPWQAGCIRLDTLTVEALLCLRHLEDEEGFERLTCRPVHLRGADELRIRYQTALEDPATLICGVYLRGTLRPVGKLTASNYNSRNRGRIFSRSAVEREGPHAAGALRPLLHAPAGIWTE